MQQRKLHSQSQTNREQIANHTRKKSAHPRACHEREQPRLLRLSEGPRRRREAHVLAGLRGVLAASVHFIIKCEKGANFGCNIPMLRSDRAYIYSPDARLSCRKLSISRRGGTDVSRNQGFTWFSFAHPLFNISPYLSSLP
jgi:hypothetical protein